MKIPFRTGSGFDVHRFYDQPSDDAVVTLCGIDVPHDRALLAHSDGDVAIHALCDALLGALALGDIGQHFPDTDANYSGISSALLLRHVMGLVHKAGWLVGNADLTLLAEAPKMAPHVPAMREKLAHLLGVEEGAVSVKATTTEKLGFTGRGEGIACQAQVLLADASVCAGD